MKITAHIYKIETNGETMHIAAQGTAQKSAYFMESMSSIQI